LIQAPSEPKRFYQFHRIGSKRNAHRQASGDVFVAKTRKNDCPHFSFLIFIMTYFVIFLLLAALGICCYVIYRNYEQCDFIKDTLMTLRARAFNQRFKLEFIACELDSLRKEMQADCGKDTSYIDGSFYIYRLENIVKAIQETSNEGV